MTLPIDRLFGRLSLTYGSAWDNSIGTAPLNEIKTFWMHELSPFLKSKESMRAITWALENLPERPPNLVHFKNLCYRAPEVERPQLPSPPADPVRVQKELAKLTSIKAERHDYKDWARRILHDYENGIPRRPLYVKWAKEALSAPNF